jgi:diphthine-ammonia ligase
MCGIAGAYGVEATAKVRTALQVMSHRGHEAAGIHDGVLTVVSEPSKLPYSGSTNCLGHVLHAMVGCVAQPLEGKGVLVANCEIYNWQELAEQEGIAARNDVDVLLHLLDKHHPDMHSVLSQLDGVYAFAYARDDAVTICRDLLGVKPLYYVHDSGFVFASERKALQQLGYTIIRELIPRTILTYNTTNNTVTEQHRPFFTLTPEHEETLQKQEQQVMHLLSSAVEKRIPDAKFGLLLSGGVDSSVLAFLMKSRKPLCYVVGEADSPDVLAAKKLAAQIGLPLKVVSPTLQQIEDELPALVKTIEDSNPVKVGVAVTFWFACKAAQEDGCRAVFSGLGAEELFAGYERHRRSTDINRECLAGLRKLHERDLYRDDVITMYHGIELRLPFLDKDLVQYSLRIPPQYKIADGLDKKILRDVSAALGLDASIAYRPKKAAQYGSGIMKQLIRVGKNKRVPLAEYLASLYGGKNKKLGALLSTGKDSLLALHVMDRMQYTISCCITIESTNVDSYMFHTPGVHLASLQADALGIPLITAQTAGEKETELEALETALKEAIDTYQIEGVIAGALASQYQRERIEAVCDRLGLTVFSPLWQMDQLKELNMLLSEGYTVIFTKVAAEGLDASWLGATLDKSRVEKLRKLHEQFGVHPAGEGGEYESLVLDAPLFKKKLVLTATEIIKDGSAATLIVKGCTSVPK